MRIWFDILTPKQVNFFKPIIQELEKDRNNEILCTGRNYRELTELAALKGLDNIIYVGEHGGKSLSGKLKAGAKRTQQLIDVVEKFRPDLLVSLCSPESSRVAFGFGIKHLGFCDAPHAEAQCRLCLPLMSKVMCPSIIPTKAYTRYGIGLRDLIRYKALDPAMWLLDDKESMYHTHKDLGLDPAKRTITFRLAESAASYLSLTDQSISIRMLGALKSLAEDYNIVVLSRYLDQIVSVKKAFDQKFIVLEKVVDGKSLLMLTDVFIGSGGTMNWEGALMGIPGISYTPMKYHINEYLIKKGMIARCNDHNVLLKLVRRMLSDERYKKRLKRNSKTMLTGMEDLKTLTIKTIRTLVKEHA
jgi:hypothetical protein